MPANAWRWACWCSEHALLDANVHAGGGFIKARNILHGMRHGTRRRRAGPAFHYTYGRTEQDRLPPTRTFGEIRLGLANHTQPFTTNGSSDTPPHSVCHLIKQGNTSAGTAPLARLDSPNVRHRNRHKEPTRNDQSSTPSAVVPSFSTARRWISTVPALHRKDSTTSSTARGTNQTGRCVFHLAAQLAAGAVVETTQ